MGGAMLGMVKQAANKVISKGSEISVLIVLCKKDK